MGGDEILGGYNSHALLALNEMIKNKKSNKIINNLSLYLGINNSYDRINKLKNY